MTINAPPLEEWSPEVASDIALDKSLATDENKTEAEIRHAKKAQSTGSNRHERAALIASGKKPAQEQTTDITAKTSHLADIRLARELHRGKMAATRHREGQRLCLSLKPAYDALAKRFAESLAAGHSALVEMTTLENTLRAQNIGFYPTVCNLATDRVFGSPFDRTSNFAILLRECVQMTHLKSLPKELT